MTNLKLLKHTELSVFILFSLLPLNILQNVGPIGKPRKKASKVKKAPDFSKLHRKWEDQLSKVDYICFLPYVHGV